MTPGRSSGTTTTSPAIDRGAGRAAPRSAPTTATRVGKRLARRTGVATASAARSRSSSSRSAIRAKPYKILWSAAQAHLIIARSPSPRDSPNHRRPRFRIAVHAVDRAPAARAVGLLRDSAVRHAGRRDRPAAARSASSCRAARRASRRTARRSASRRSSTAGVPMLGICYGMQLMTEMLGGEVAPAPHREFGLATIRITPNAPLFASVPDGAARLGQPRRLRRRRAGRLRRDGDQRQRAGRGDGGAGSQILRAPVPSGGCTYRSRHRDPPQLRLRHLRLHRRLDDGVVRERGDRQDPGAGRRGAGRLRPERRRRLDGRGAADPPGDRRSADVHLRRQRRDAPRRGGADPQAVRAAEPAAGLRRRRRRCSSIGWPASPIRRRSARSSARRSSRCSRRRRRSWDRSISWRRARCIPT